MITMKPITTCSTPTCGDNIYVKDVFREAFVKDSPAHVVAIYKCPSCGRKDRIVGTWEQWNTHKQEELQSSYETDKTIRAALIELQYVDSVDDLKALWASFKYPPLIEGHIGKCECDACRKRLFYEGE